MSTLSLIQIFEETKKLTAVWLRICHFLANIWELLSDKARERKDLQPQESISFKEAIK